VDISNVSVIVADGCGIFINIDVLDINKGSGASHLITGKDLIAGKLHVPFLVRLRLFWNTSYF